MAIALYVAVLVFLSVTAIVGTTLLYYLSEAYIPIVASIIMVLGAITGFVVAVRNTFLVYINIYIKKGK